MTLADVSPAIVAQLSEEPSETYWFVWGRGTGRPGRSIQDRLIIAFAFESDAASYAAMCNGRINPLGQLLDGYPREATVKEAHEASPSSHGVGLYDREGNLIRRLA